MILTLKAWYDIVCININVDHFKKLLFSMVVSLPKGFAQCTMHISTAQENI